MGVIGSLDTPYDKPSPELVIAVLGPAQFVRDDPGIWFVGDTHIDIECARNTGCTPVMVHNPAEAQRLGVKLTFDNCHQLLAALQSSHKNRP